jgi:hypothetical protein
MLYDNLPKILKKYSRPCQTQDAAQDVLRYFWPNHDVIWITSTGTYDNIEQHISEKTQDIIILQTEEDWFKKLDVVEIRKKIVGCKKWTNNSFVITNSEEDYHISKNFLNVLYKPGIFDLICYKPYSNKTVFDLNQIKYHTAFNYSRKDLARSTVVKMLMHYESKISCVSYDHETIINHENLDVLIKKGDVLDAPFIDISKDQSWADISAFLTVTETFNDFVIDPSITVYTPVLSEKTYRAFHLCRPALIYGGSGTKQKLNQLGFDTWDWLIDWSFDFEKDPQKSFKMFLLELRRLLELDINIIVDLIDRNQQSLINNQYRIKELINNYGKDN